jgi:hypothetical protein
MLAPALLSIMLAAGPAPAPRGASSPVEAACSEAPSGTAGDAAACEGKGLCTAPERVKLTCELSRALEERYVFFDTKRVAADGRSGGSLSLAEHLAACVAAERAIGREEEPLRFYDRLRRCTAALEDGHLVLGSPARLPTVALGLGLRQVDGRIVIATREERLVRDLSATRGEPLEGVLAVGNEILEIDGAPAQERLEALARHVPGSSAAARLERALDALTRRDFLFPERKVATLTISAGGREEQVELPWWISPDGKDHPLAAAHVRRLGLETTSLLRWGHERARDGAESTARAVHGTLRSDTILPPRDAAALREHHDERGRVAMRTGEVSRGEGRVFCYAQLLTFHTETLSSEDGAPRPFRRVVEGFVRDCKERRLDLVLDLRRNEGGYLMNATALVAALLPPETPAPAGALLLRATAQNRAIYEERARRHTWPSDGPAPTRALAALEEASREGRRFTPAFLEGPVRPSPAVGGYDRRVVALVGPTCMSACDRAAAMLRGAGGAVLLGEPTEGAGASQQEVPGSIGTRWSDRSGLVTLAIPNAAMGVPRSAPAAAEERDADEFFAALALENRPVEPDLPYAPRLEDVTEHNRGWLARVEALLFPPEGDSVAALR